MSQTSEQSRTIPVDAQSVQSGQTQQSERTQQTGTTQVLQQQSSSQGGERSGRTERRIQRSSSSASSRSGGSANGAANGRAEGPIGTGSYQQYSAEGVQAYGASNGSLGSAVSGERRQGRYRRQVIRLPDQNQGTVRQVRRRLPTPEPDTLERVYIQRTAGEVVEEITEIPTTPPPRVQERTVVEPAGPPQVVKRTIRVPPRGGGYQQQQQTFQTQQQAFQPQQQAFQPQQQTFQPQQSGSLLGAGSYGNIQHSSGSFQQQANASYSSGYSGAAAPPSFGPYGAMGGGGFPFMPQQGNICFTVDANSPIKPPLGCTDHAQVFYVPSA